MVLYRGMVYETSYQKRLLDGMEEDINETRKTKRLDIRKVIDAVDVIGRKLAAGVYTEKINELGMEGFEKQLEEILPMMTRKAMEHKLSTELGDLEKNALLTGRTTLRSGNLASYICPLGTLFHIAAGNRQGLPVFSVIEGLLTGNINILKLPQADGGLSLEIIKELIKTEPEVADFIYVFDTPSSDLESMKKMAEMSDGIVVWGGDEAVSAVRTFAPIGAKIIEWGHKLSFAYFSNWEKLGKEALLNEMTALAEHIVSTKQLLCSSCQVIYLDTEDEKRTDLFCRVFLPILDKAAAKYPAQSVGMRAELNLRRYCDELNSVILEEAVYEKKIYQGKKCSLTLSGDDNLELSELFGNCLVKKLPRGNMMQVLRRQKGYLQTAGLVCPEKERETLSGMLADSGIVRVTKVSNMSKMFPGEAHDGEYPLRRYIRSVDVEK